MDEKTIKILVVDASSVWRKILVNMLLTAPDITVVGEYGSGQGSLLLLDEMNPDVVLLNPCEKDQMPLADIVKQLHAISPKTGVIICVDQIKADEVMPVVDQCECDFLTKPYKRAHVLRTIRECVNKVTAS